MKALFTAAMKWKPTSHQLSAAENIETKELQNHKIFAKDIIDEIHISLSVSVSVSLRLLRLRSAAAFPKYKKPRILILTSAR
jgi:hypothetical protein